MQSRIVVAENLPEDQKHQTLMKIFSAVGRYAICMSVNTNSCQPDAIVIP